LRNAFGQVAVGDADQLDADIDHADREKHLGEMAGLLRAPQEDEIEQDAEGGSHARRQQERLQNELPL
jgi:hypothetical protein